MMLDDRPVASGEEELGAWMDALETLTSFPVREPRHRPLVYSLVEAVTGLVPADHFAIMSLRREEGSAQVICRSDKRELSGLVFSLSECPALVELPLGPDASFLQYTKGSALLAQLGKVFQGLEQVAVAAWPISEDEGNGAFILFLVRENSVFSERELGVLGQMGRVLRILLKCYPPAGPSLSSGESAPVSEGEDVEMVGTCESMRRVFSTLRKFATADAPVLIAGESGTGKEIAARTIHERSIRAKGPFVPINCGAIPETLLESELFGHEKGAFTGAHALKKGKVEMADKGTLFLDEVGELSLSLQVKLLRFLEDFRFERVGGNRLLQVDVRVIAATNKDLGQAAKKGEFREDLYYRLAVLSLNLPPLRERDEDAIVMARVFLQRYVKESERPILGFTPEALSAIRNHPWPGNVRELVNRIRRAVVMADGAWVGPADLGLEGHEGMSRDDSPLSLPAARGRLEKDLIQKALLRHGGNIARAARELCVSRPHLYQLMEKHNCHLAKKPGNRSKFP